MNYIRALFSRTFAESELLRQMVGAFRKYYHADWVEDAEIDLFMAVIDGKPFGKYEITSRERRAMKFLIWRIGGFYVFPDGYETPLLLTDPQFRDFVATSGPRPVLAAASGYIRGRH